MRRIEDMEHMVCLDCHHFQPYRYEITRYTGGCAKETQMAKTLAELVESGQARVTGSCTLYPTDVRKSERQWCGQWTPILPIPQPRADQDIRDFEFSVRAFNALDKAGIKTIMELSCALAEGRDREWKHVGTRTALEMHLLVQAWKSQREKAQP